jgi:hypothetical protein
MSKEVKNEDLFQNEELSGSKEKAVKKIAKQIKETAQKSKTETVSRKRPSLFVNDQNIKIEITVLYSYESGEVLSVFSNTLPIDEHLKEIMGIEELVFEFSKMSYDQLRGYREVCSYIDNNTNALQINSMKMRDCYVYYHLKGWNLKDEEGNDIELKFTETGSLSEESVKQFYALTPAIIDIAINEYENKLNI